MLKHSKKDRKILENFNRLKISQRTKRLKLRKIKPMLRLIKRDVIQVYREHYKGVYHETLEPFK